MQIPFRQVVPYDIRQGLELPVNLPPVKSGELAKAKERLMNALRGAIYPDLDGKTVIVTGGASGIGETLVTHFAAQKAKVGFIDVKLKEGRALAEKLAQKQRNTHFQHCDLKDIAALKDAIASIRGRLGRVSILINNAGHDDRHKTEEVTPGYFDERIAVNLKHQFFAAQAVVEDMKAIGGGSIINFGSTSWMIGLGGMAIYTAAKSAVIGLTRSLARDYGPYNIRVNAIAPGWIMTKRQIELWLTPEGEQAIMTNQCLKRKLKPEDIAKFTVFLASEEASACTAQHYVVDGGWV
jgi:NAD(P)-dependent dehydrogenase (short-subunit alcohol dehydrogenase family)